jgi:hypothetical protein
MTFETQWQLDNFREIESDLFHDDGKRYSATPISNREAEQMYKLIYQLAGEIYGLESENEELKKAYQQACDAAGANEQRAREAESEIRNILNDIER